MELVISHWNKSMELLRLVIMSLCITMAMEESSSVLALMELVSIKIAFRKVVNLFTKASLFKEAFAVYKNLKHSKI